MSIDVSIFIFRLRFCKSSQLTAIRYQTNDSANIKEPPVKYSTSKAGSWQTVDTFSPPPKDMPWYQPYSVILSIVAFLVYFGILREENDIDQELSKTLYERMPGLEEHQLKESIKFNTEKGKDTTALKARLAELRNEK